MSGSEECEGAERVDSVLDETPDEGGGNGKHRRRSRRAGKKIQRARSKAAARAKEDLEASELVQASDHKHDINENGNEDHDITKSVAELKVTIQPPPTDALDDSPELAPRSGSTTPTQSPLKKKAPDSGWSKLNSNGRSAEDWSDPVVGDIWKRTNADGTQDEAPQPPSVDDLNHQKVFEWFHAQTAQHFRNHSAGLQQRAIEHLTKYRYTHPDDEEWRRQVRLLVWRAVVRANFFWTNPHTGEEAGKPKPISRPAGSYENHFDTFVSCAAERLDRIDRDLPNAEWVKTVEDEVRDFLERCESGGKTTQLEHLAFLLLFDEDQRKGALGLADLQDRIRRTVMGSDISWKGLEMIKRGKPPAKPDLGPSTVSSAEAIWRDAIAML